MIAFLPKTRMRRRMISVVAILTAVISLGSLSMTNASASSADGPSTFNVGCQMSNRNWWGSGCFGTLYLSNFDRAWVTYGADDRATDGHYVYVQRDLSWVAGGYETMATSGGAISYSNHTYDMVPGHRIDVRIKRSGIGDTLYIGTINL